MKRERTDLAYERYSEGDKKGLAVQEDRIAGCRLHILEAKEETAGIPRGRHTTLFFPEEGNNPFTEGDRLADVLFSLLRDEAIRLCGEKSEGLRVLFVGLGNQKATVDSFGPAAAARIHPTAHLRKDIPALFSLLSAAELAFFCPGVSSASGIESHRLLHAVADCFHPSLLLVADSLVAKSPAHLGRTLQISDAGIRPGSGVRRPTAAIDAAFVACPVLSIGMPTAIAGEALLPCGGEENAFPADHVFAPATIGEAIEEGAAAVAAAVERLFGIPR